MWKKIGNRIGFFFWTSFLLLGEAQSVSVNLKPERIIFGESTRYYVTVKDIKEPSPPQIPENPDFQIQELPPSSNSRQMISFGAQGLVQEEHFEMVFRYIITPKKVGQCEISGFTYTHESFSQGVQPILFYVEKEAPGNKYVEVVLKTVPSEKIYLGQPFVLQIVITSERKLPPDNCTIDTEWIVDLPNFTIGEPKIPPKGKAFDILLDVPNMRRGDRIPFEREVMNREGVVSYQYTFQQEYIAMNSGSHQIPSCLLRCGGLFDENRGRWIDLKVIEPSNSLDLLIQDAPEEGRPESYCGGIGTFTFESSLEKNEIALGEALVFRLKIRGIGNLKTMGLPKIPAHPNFKYYEPKMEIKETGKRYEQEATILAEVVPKASGTYALPPVLFSYFDIQKKTYQTLTSPAFEVKVQKTEGTTLEVGGPSKENSYKEIKTGVQYIKEELSLLNHQNYYFKNTFYWLLYPITLLLYTIFTLRRRFLQRYSGNESLKAKDQAYKKASLRLIETKDNRSVANLYEIVTTFLSEKLMLPLGMINTKQIVEPLTQQHVKPENIQTISKLLEEMEHSRFGGVSIENLETRVTQALNQLEKL
ncbi:MAG: BatD family protein [Planctomycetota bacterium]